MASTFDLPLEHLKSIDRFERALASVRAPPVGKKSDGRRAVRLNSAPTFSNPRIRNAPWFIPLVERDNLRKEIKFAGDSPLEEGGFELVVPL